MIADKLTFPAGTKATLAPARTIPANTMPMLALDFTSKNLRWHDDPNGQTLSVSGITPGSLQIMGAGTATAYNSTWEEQDARVALLAQLGLTLPSAI
jgi:hypothetical protein